jgi:hypothetical protein
MHLGQHTAPIRRQVLRLLEVKRGEGRLRVGLHDHDGGGHAGRLALDEVFFADDVVRQPLPLLTRALPCVDVERLIRLAVVRDRHDPGGLGGRGAAQIQLVERALRHQRLRWDGLRGCQQVLAGAALEEAHARHRRQPGAERLDDRAGLEDDLRVVRVFDDAARFRDLRGAHVVNPLDRGNGGQEQSRDQQQWDDHEAQDPPEAFIFKPTGLRLPGIVAYCHGIDALLMVSLTGWRAGQAGRSGPCGVWAFVSAHASAPRTAPAASAFAQRTARANCPVQRLSARERPEEGGLQISEGLSTRVRCTPYIKPQRARARH